MNTRLNITIPREVATKLRKFAPKKGISKFIAEAAEERIKSLEREKALKELLAAPPTFTKIKDSVKYIRKMRRFDERRMKRLGI